jgi:hypothetical protein
MPFSLAARSFDGSPAQQKGSERSKSSLRNLGLVAYVRGEVDRGLEWSA